MVEDEAALLELAAAVPGNHVAAYRVVDSREQHPAREIAGYFVVENLHVGDVAAAVNMNPVPREAVDGIILNQLRECLGARADVYSVVPRRKPATREVAVQNGERAR